MSDATLWINDTNDTAEVKNGSAIHTMPLWAFKDMRDIIVAEAEKKVEVTHRDFDIQQELLDRYRSDNAALLELVGILVLCTNDEAHDCDKCAINGADMRATVPEWLFCDSLIERLRALGFEVKE